MPHSTCSLLTPTDRRAEPAINVDAVCGSISRIMTDVKRAPETDRQTEGGSGASGESQERKAVRRRRNRCRKSISQRETKGAKSSSASPRLPSRPPLSPAARSPHRTTLTSVHCLEAKVGSPSTFPSTRDKFLKKSARCRIRNKSSVKQRLRYSEKSTAREREGCHRQ